MREKIILDKIYNNILASLSPDIKPVILIKQNNSICESSMGKKV